MPVSDGKHAKAFVACTFAKQFFEFISTSYFVKVLA